MRRLVLSTFALLVLVLAAVAFARGSGEPTARAQAKPGLTPLQQRLMSGFASRALEAQTAPALVPRAREMRPAQGGVGSTSETGCPANRGSNVRVNQNCLNLSRPRSRGARPGAERDRRSRRTRTTRGTWSRRRTTTAAATATATRRTPPTTARTLDRTRRRRWASPAGTRFGGVARQYWQAGGDTSVAWDTKGNAYLSCQMFNARPGRVATTRTSRARSTSFARPARTARRGTSRPARSPSSTTSPAAGDGAARQAVPDGRRPPGSPFQDRIYVTWTLFAADGTAYIYEAYSRDYGEHFSAPKLVSTDERAVHQHARHPDAAGHAATRTSSRSRSPGPTARCTSSGTTTT